jgi:signal transduction histidine kinase/CheY-like chemotaxis protein/HPt (histidine-containing phosphotransfer) domain-containing protein
MSLQKKIVSLFLVLGLVFSLGSYLGLRTFVLPTFEDFEQTSANENMDRVSRALQAELNALEVVNREYSEWDHTHEYASGTRPGYVDENLDVSYWTNIDIHGMLFFDLEGQLLWGSIVDLTVKNKLSIETELVDPLGQEHPLLGPTRTQSAILGLMQARTAPLLVSSLPIMKSNGNGPPAGSLVVVRFLDPALVEELGHRAGVQASFRSAADFGPGEIAADGSTLWIRNRDTMTGREGIADIFGNPAFVLEVAAPRTISAIGNDTIKTTLLFFVASTMLFLLGGWIFTRRLIVTPVGALTRRIHKIRETGDLTQTEDSGREDEIGLLQREFGRLAERLGNAQRELESARDQALAVSNAKSDFFAKMSHEIRTPLNGVLGMLELLSNTPLDRVQKRYMQSIRESADTLLDIISDILDFSKIEAGKLTLEHRAFNLNTFVSDVTDSLAALAAQKGLQLNHIAPDGPPVNVEADPIRLRQILTNLLGNAIKFTERGGVLLKVTSSLDVGDFESFTFEVVDTGIGIAPHKQQQIFNSFAQEDASTTRRYGGTGLGLSISKQLVEMMGGEITVQSAPGKGSTFSFTLRLRADRKGAMSSIEDTFTHIYGELDAANSAVSPLEGKVLVAEDNAVNQAVAQGLLESIGVESQVVSNGQEAVDAFMTGRYDAILMDCQMPLLDGYQATEEIRRIESRRHRDPIRVVAVTANVLAGDMEKCIASGMDDYLRKPYSGEQLYAALAKVLPPGVAAAHHELKANPDLNPGVPVPQPDGEALDDQVLDSLAALPLAGDKSLVNQVIQTYINSSLDLMTRLGEAIDRGDAECIRTAAHSLKSSSANVGAVRLAELCASIETSTRASDRASAVTLQRQIKNEYPRVVDALRRRIEAAA